MDENWRVNDRVLEAAKKAQSKSNSIRRAKTFTTRDTAKTYVSRESFNNIVEGDREMSFRESFFTQDNPGAEIERNLKGATWYKSLSISDQQELSPSTPTFSNRGIAQKSRPISLDNLVQVDIHPLFLRFSVHSAEVDYREKHFNRLSPYHIISASAVLLAIECSSLAYDLVLINEQCHSYNKANLACILLLQAAFVIAPTIILLIRQNFIVLLFPHLKATIDSVLLASGVAVGSITKLLFFDCIHSRENKIAAYNYALFFLVVHLIARSWALHVLYESYLYAVFFVIAVEMSFLSVTANIFEKNEAASLVCAFGAFALYGMRQHNMEKISRTYYLLNSAKRLQYKK